MGKLLWTPSPQRVHASNMYRFMQWINERFSQSLKTYPDLYQWSIEHISPFWDALWEYIAVKAKTPH